jgi:hypothetical protein
MTPTDGTYSRVVDAGRPIGKDIATGQQTSTHTVITEPNGDLKTAFPGLVGVQSMGLTIALETERREQVETVVDPRRVLKPLIPSVDDMSYRCLCFIDPYGDTVFNRRQVPTVIAELDRLRGLATIAEQVSVLDAITALARECQTRVHHYLVFYGD